MSCSVLWYISVVCFKLFYSADADASVIVVPWLYFFCVFCKDTVFFFFNATAPTEIYPLSLNDALPVGLVAPAANCWSFVPVDARKEKKKKQKKQKSTLRNSRHGANPYSLLLFKT